MKWFNKWFANKCRQAWEDENQPQEDVLGNLVAPAKMRRGIAQISTGPAELHSRGVTFTLYKANGGHVVELRDYDPQTDRHANSLHLVPSDKDMGEALNHIITYEALKR
jgi:hypothetical protein